MSLIANEILRSLLIIAWLVFMLPLFASLHRFFSPRRTTLGSRFYAPHHWYGELFDVLKQRPSQKTVGVDPFRRRLMLFISIFFGLTIISALPLIPLQEGLKSLSLSFLLSFIFLQGFSTLALGLTASDTLSRLTMIEQFFSRQALVLVICLCCLVLPEDPFASVSDVHIEVIYFWRAIPSYSILLNPIAFCVALIALAIYTRQWLENEVPLRANLINPIEAELSGTIYVMFHISRNLEYFAIYALLVTLFLGGSTLDSITTTNAIALAVVSIKILVTAAITLMLSQLLPHAFREKSYRVAFLWLTPIILIAKVMLAAS